VDVLSRLQIEHACARLIKVYCNSIDVHDVERLLSVFAEDSEWQRPGNPPLIGRAAIREFVEHHGVGSVSAHYVTNIVVDVEDDDHAASTGSALVFRGTGSAESGPLPMALPNLVVRYQHSFIRTASEWYIKRMETSWLFQRAKA
jgi:hypothetical protein